MSIALLGTAIIQFYFIKLNVDQSEERFSADVLDALNRVHGRLLSEAEDNQSLMKEFDAIYGKDKPNLLNEKNNLEGKIDLLPGYKKYQIDRFKAEVSDLFTIKTAILLEQIVPTTLPNIIKQELINENIF